MTSAHISIDDVHLTFCDLIIHEYIRRSIFECPFLSFLKRVHQRTGAKFTLYGFSKAEDFNISEVPDKWKNEFHDNSEWLKFGFHWSVPEYNDSSPVNEIISSCNSFCNNVIRFAGIESLSTTIRLHYFHPDASSFFDNLSSIEPFSSGITLLCATEANRHSYDLTLEETKSLYHKGHFSKFNRLYLPTDFQFESYKLGKFCCNNILRKRTYPQQIIAFTHEWALWSFTEKRELLSYILNGAKYPPPQIIRKRVLSFCDKLKVEGFTFI